MTSSLHIIDLVGVVSLISVTIAAIKFVWFNHGFFPVLKLRIELTEMNENGLLSVRLTAENNSSVSAKLRKGKARLQILEYDTSQVKEFSTLDEWIPFDEEAKERDSKVPIRWKDPSPVMTSTTHIEAGESIRIERIYRSSAPGVAVHCGFQVFTNPWRIPFRPDRFTTTAWILMSSSTGAVTRKTAA